MWDPNLKPITRQCEFKSILLIEYAESSTEPYPQLMLDEIELTMLSLSYTPKKDKDSIKTSCPDIITGLHHDIIAAKLKLMGIVRPYADDLIKDLQYERTLISCSAQLALLFQFPPFIIKGKSYVTGKIIVKAQNQAAISESIILIIYNKLSKLAKTHSPNSSLAFSIYSKEPVLEL